MMRSRLPSAVATLAFLLASSLQAQSIDPPSYSATMSVGQTITINKTITLGPAGANLVDLFFLADNTGSMGGEITNMKNGASAILGNVPTGADYRFGVAEYNSDPCEASEDYLNYGTPYSTCSGYPSSYGTAPFYAENQGLTSNTTDVQNAINTWNASGGGDTPEANFYALEQLANTAGWRTGSQRLVVWFGDAWSHTATTTQQEAIDALQAAGATVIAFNSGGSGSGIDYGGQATAIVNSTGGTLNNGFNSIALNDFVNAVNSQISLATSTLDLVFGSTFVGSGLTLEFVCTDVRGCTDVAGSESRTFDVNITANEVGTYDFSVFAAGVAAEEVDRIVVVDTVVPEPSTWLMLATGLFSLGFIARKRREDDEVV